MAKYRLNKKNNIMTIIRKGIKKVPLNEREMNVFEDNLMPGFFRPKLESPRRIVYTAPAGMSLAEYMERNFTIHKLYSVITQIVEISKKIDRYNFYLYNLVLDEKLVYVKEITGELFFLYEPLSIRENSTNVYAFIGDIVRGIKTEDRNLRAECQLIDSFLASPDHYRIEEIEILIRQRYPQIYQQIKPEDSGLSGYIRSSRLSKMTSDIATDIAAASNGYLVRRKTNQTINIETSEFRIGKDTTSDLIISDNNAISRAHAVIIKKNNKYFILDNNSTNKTYLNGMIVDSLTGATLNHGDVIKLADEEFEFYAR